MLETLLNILSKYWTEQHWPHIVATFSLLISTSAFILSYKIRRDGIIIKLIPKFTTFFERADKKYFYNSFINKSGEVGFEVQGRLTIRNSSPFTLEILEINSPNYYLTRGMDCEPLKDLHTLIPKVERCSLIKADKENFYSFTAFVFDSARRSNAKQLPDIILLIKTLQHSNPSCNKKNFRVIRSVEPNLIVTEIK